MKVNLNPARGGCDILSVILCPPPLHKTHPKENLCHTSADKFVEIPDGAHLGQFVHGLEAVVDGLREEGGKLLVVEDLETAAWRDLADRGRVKPGTRLIT